VRAGKTSTGADPGDFLDFWDLAVTPVGFVLVAFAGIALVTEYLQISRFEG
jgi:TRAP-type mannitol/chloroaromatic compound transport system permease small subunit